MRLGGAGLALAVAMAWGAASPALAWTAEVAWPTFYRAGPGKHYAVLDELQRGERLDVQSCDDTWCRVLFQRVTGYVEKNTLLTPEQMPQKPSAQPASGGNCFFSRIDGAGAGELYRFCSR